jgi:uncharacterized iron-regulated protein
MPVANFLFPGAFMTEKKKIVPHARASWLSPKTGRPLDTGRLLRRMAGMDAVLLGETHNVAEIHRWQLHVAASLHVLRPNLMIGFEMFPRRLQPVLDAWVDGKLETEAFIEKSEWYKVWGFPAEIYLPLFHFCRQQGVRMLALNCYRALVTRVGKEGWENVPEAERDGLTPAAPATPAYRRYLRKIGERFGKHPVRGKAIDEDRFIRAQQTWDRAFACNIERALREARASASSPLIVGIIGRGHLEFGHGTPYQLKDLGVGKVGVLLTSERAEFEFSAMKGMSDAVFRIDVPEAPVERLASPGSGG